MRRDGKRVIPFAVFYVCIKSNNEKKRKKVAIIKKKLYICK